MMWRAVRFVILLAAVVAAVHAVAGQATAAPAPPQPAPIPLSTALDMLESGAAASATLESTPGATTLTVRLKGVDRVTALPATLIERVIEYARQGGVPLRVAQPAAEAADAPAGSGGIDIEAFVQTWGPLILLAGLVIVSALALRMAGGARFKQQVRAVRSPVRFADVAGIDEIRDEVAEIARRAPAA